MTARRWWLGVSMLLAMGVTGGCGDDDDDDDTSADGDADSDSDSDSDSDADADGDGDGDGDADGDGDGDADGDADMCPAGQPAGPLPVKGCRAPEFVELDYLCDDVGPCAVASDCALINVDDCCNHGWVAVLAARAPALSAAVEPCPTPNAKCISCPGEPDIDCVAGQCALVPPTCEGLGPSVMECDWQCVDTSQNLRYCGDCETTCVQGQVCTDGVCVGP